MYLLGASILLGERIAMLHMNFRGGRKNPRSANKYTKLGQLIISKIIKIIATSYHILRLKCTKLSCRPLSVRLSVRPFVS